MNNRFLFDSEKKSNFDFIIGTDEAGRGPGAGPVFAAAVCFNNLNDNLISSLDKLNDSKKLSEKTREELFDIIIKNSIYSIMQGSVEDIEKYNILKTSLMTMQKACNNVINQLKTNNILILIDGNKLIPNYKYKQEYIIKGDYKSAAIAAASILAKVSRDRFMLEIDKKFPQYHWAENKGYLTKSHLKAVDNFGLCEWHRKKFFEKHFEKSTQLSLL